MSNYFLPHHSRVRILNDKKLIFLLFILFFKIIFTLNDSNIYAIIIRSIDYLYKKIKKKTEIDDEIRLFYLQLLKFIYIVET